MTKTSTREAASETEAMLLAYAASLPESGQFSVAEALYRRGVRISPAAVRAMRKRHELETLYKRVSATEKRGPRKRPGMTEGQRARFKRAARRRQLLGEADAAELRVMDGMRRTGREVLPRAAYAALQRDSGTLLW